LEQEEIWKQIIIEKGGTVYDYSELYEVSNKEGRIRSVKTGKTLKPGKDKWGYSHVTLYKDGKTSRFSVHRLVATMFIPNPENKPTVNHKDENKENNSADNLEWMTHEEQQKHGTCRQRISEAQLGGKNHMAKKVKCIETGEIFDTVKEAEEWCGIKDGVTDCCKGKYKTAGGFHWEYVKES
jgi:phage pi2 protein 07